jgi:hypothetical protein
MENLMKTDFHWMEPGLRFARWAAKICAIALMLFFYSLVMHGSETSRNCDVRR